MILQFPIKDNFHRMSMFNTLWLNKVRELKIKPYAKDKARFLRYYRAISRQFIFHFDCKKNIDNNN